jgi:hypothetical protein
MMPKAITSTYLNAPATEYPIRSVTPELVPDNMASRLMRFEETEAQGEAKEQNVQETDL